MFYDRDALVRNEVNYSNIITNFEHEANYSPKYSEQ